MELKIINFGSLFQYKYTFQKFCFLVLFLIVSELLIFRASKKLKKSFARDIKIYISIISFNLYF